MNCHCVYSIVRVEFLILYVLLLISGVACFKQVEALAEVIVYFILVYFDILIRRDRYFLRERTVNFRIVIFLCIYYCGAVIT